MRVSRFRFSLLAALGALLIVTAAAQAQTAPGAQAGPEDWAAFLRPDPRYEAIGRTPIPMPTRVLVEAALLASGVPAERMEYYTDRLRRAFEPLREKAARLEDPALRGEAILPFLHRGLFKTYREDATTVDGLIDTGEYNCVSSAVVYLIAARVLVLDIKGVQTPDHAFCVLAVPGRDIDVETTNPFGFDPGTSKKFKSSFTKTTRFVYIPPGDYTRRRTITEKELVGLILHNRAVDLQRAGRHLEVLRMAVDRAAAFPGADASAFLADAAFNAAAELTNRRDWSGALSLALAVRETAGPGPRLEELVRTASYNFAADAHNRFAERYNARDYAAARRVIEEALRRLPDNPVLKRDLAELD